MESLDLYKILIFMKLIRFSIIGPLSNGDNILLFPRFQCSSDSN